MDKILVMVRTSTSVQDVTDQHKEMEEFCLSEGWKKNQIVWVEEQGASAAKVDDTYRAMIDSIKARIETDANIKCFAVWHLNRAFRTEEIYIELKTFLVAHKVQCICKNPYLHLLTPDGKVDPGMELAMGLLAILAKQDNDERKAKFARAKQSMAKKGQYIGGNVRPFGYKIEGKYFVEDEEEGKIVRTIFELYSTGTYSAHTLSKELNQRGIAVNDRKIVRILKNPAYKGDEIGKLGVHYPPIISKELFETVEKIRANNKLDMRKGERVVLGAKLVKCYNCGATCTSNSRHYVCCKHSHSGECKNGFSIRQKVVDSILWRTASNIHLNYLIDLNENKVDEYRNELNILDEKIVAGTKKMDEFDDKKSRIVDSYLERLIDKKTRDLRLSKLQDDIRDHQVYLKGLQEKRDSILRLLELGNPDSVEAFSAALDTMDSEDMYDIIHKHIKSLIAKPVSFGERDPRTHKPNGVEITVTPIIGEPRKFMYIPNHYKGSNLYVWNGRKWVADQF